MKVKMKTVSSSVSSASSVNPSCSVQPSRCQMSENAPRRGDRTPMDWQNENCRNILLAVGFVLFILAVAISATAAS